jgi:dTDP-glucose 4,6-dehydratase
MALVGNPKAHLDFRPLPTDDPKQRQPNITKAREILGWEPKYDRAKGLALTYEYFKKAVKVD